MLKRAVLKRGLKRGLVLGALLAAASLPAFAQVQDQKPKRLKDADIEVIKDGIRTVKTAGECMVIYTVGKDGKPKDAKADCTPAEYAPFALKAIETIEWLPEIVGGETFEIEGVKQPFKFGALQAPAVVNRALPKISKPIDMRAVTRASDKVGQPGECLVKMTVGLDGKPKDVVPNCTPDKYNKLLQEALEDMRFEPGTQAGKPVEWPGFEYPMRLGQERK